MNGPGALLTLVNLHYAGVALLALVNMFLLTQMYVAWRAQSTQGAEALAQQQSSDDLGRAAGQAA